MSLERKKRALQLLDEALERTAEERQAFLDESCGDDPTLRRDVESLLDTDADGGILREPAFSVHAEDESIGRLIDSYKLVRLLDRGGMGTVYLAEREDFEKRVALKLIRRGLDLDEVLVRRFHNERQILARLEHPNIARLLDGGTADRLPYFVMEYVEGEPIDRFCEARKLSVDECLELFRKVCSAVHFAHQNLVIHRDLKPGNILITADGTPKLLDFGIAKLLDDGLAAQAVATETGLALMTPRYASPEQIRLEPITTASDVYALGVVLYELLTGLDPYDVDTARRDEIARAICEQEPEKPSTAVRKRAAERTADPHQLRRRLSGDLDSIVLKAMRKEPHERYSSAEELSEDIRRHLTGLAVAARVGSFTYHAAKFVRRNRLALAVAAAFLLLVSGGTALWRQAVRERELADRERQGAEAALDFVEGVFRDAGPTRAKGGTILDLLESAKEKLEKVKDNRLRTSVGGALGEVFRSFGAYDEAEELMKISLESARKEYREDRSEVAKRISNLAVLYLDREDYEEAERSFREALEMMIELGSEPAELVRFKVNLATSLMLQDEFGEAERLFREVLTTRLELYVPNHANVATSYRHLGAVYFAQGEYERAEADLQKSLAIRRQLLDANDVRIAAVLNLLGIVLAELGERDEAEQAYVEALNIRLGRPVRNERDIAITKTNLAALLAHQVPETAQVLLTQALGYLYDNDYPGWEVAEAEGVQGVVLKELGCYEEAEFWLVESREKLKDIRGSENFRTREAIERLEELYEARNPAEKGRSDR